MRVSVRFRGFLEKVMGAREIEVSLSKNAMTVRQLLSELVTRFPALSGYFPVESQMPVCDFVLPVVNGRIADSDDLLYEGDVVTLLPPMDGG